MSVYTLGQRLDTNCITDLSEKELVSFDFPNRYNSSEDYKLVRDKHNE